MDRTRVNGKSSRGTSLTAKGHVLWTEWVLLWNGLNLHDVLTEPLGLGSHIELSSPGLASQVWKAFLDFVGVLQDRFTALHCAAQNGREEVVDILVSNGACLDMVNKVNEPRTMLQCFFFPSPLSFCYRWLQMSTIYVNSTCRLSWRFVWIWSTWSSIWTAEVMQG